MKRLIPLIALIALSTGGCATYICETQFGQDPPLIRDGVKYWPSRCVTEGQYKPPVKK